MPIYAYKCGSCGHAKDVLQKISDTPLTVCPACGAEAFSKQVTAAGFQLKGSGWYVTDFRGGNIGGGASAAPGADCKTESKSDSKSDSAAPASSGDAPKKESTAASTTPASTGGSSTSSTS
ncbi:MAG: zinc ribbon domain-containing protein [Acidovorax sp.]|nr:MAG: zinc ribbon domain-containing protein [Acidovorax sp.]